jgi:hypothetical protein
MRKDKSAMSEDISLTRQQIEAILEYSADLPATTWERWITYREQCPHTGRSVFWLLAPPATEERPITSATLVNGHTVEAESRSALHKLILHACPDHDVLAFVTQ